MRRLSKRLKVVGDKSRMHVSIDHHSEFLQVRPHSPILVSSNPTPLHMQSLMEDDRESASFINSSLTSSEYCAYECTLHSCMYIQYNYTVEPGYNAHLWASCYKEVAYVTQVEINTNKVNIKQSAWQFFMTPLQLLGNTLLMEHQPIFSSCSLSQSGSGWKWERYLPPMLTERILPATVTITTHLVVAAGKKTSIHGLSAVEVLDTETRQWSMTSSLPRDAGSPQMVLCSGYVYLSDVECTVFSCSVEELLHPHKTTSKQQ